ncbi:MAG: hypothetical protein ACPGOY_00695 [Rhodospirillaceae bacterium]
MALILLWASVLLFGYCQSRWARRLPPWGLGIVLCVAIICLIMAFAVLIL